LTLANIFSLTDLKAPLVILWGIWNY